MCLKRWLTQEEVDEANREADERLGEGNEQDGED